MSIVVFLVFTLLLISSVAIFADIFEPFKSFPLVLAILFAYFALIPLWLKMPPFFSTFSIRHKDVLTITGFVLFLVAVIDSTSDFAISMQMQRVFSYIGLPMSSFLVSNITYCITLVTGAFSYIIRKSHQRVKVDLQWYSKLLGSYRSKACIPPPKMMEKGYPILVSNRSADGLNITNIRLITIVGSPFVPYSVRKAFLNNDPTLSITINADEKIDMPKRIDASKNGVIYVPWKTIESAAKNISEQVDFSSTVAMSYFRLYDEFSGKEWDTPAFHILNPLFISKTPEFLKAAKAKLQKS